MSHLLLIIAILQVRVAVLTGHPLGSEVVQSEANDTNTSEDRNYDAKNSTTRHRLRDRDVGITRGSDALGYNNETKLVREQRIRDRTALGTYKQH